MACDSSGLAGNWCYVERDSNGGGEALRAPYVQKLRVPVRLSQPNQDPRDGWFLLFPRAADGETPESVVELLNSPRVVLPFIQEDRTILLLTRQNIDWVAIGASVAEELVLRPGQTLTHSQRVELRFTDES